jgi:hypothetical protein
MAERPHTRRSRACGFGHRLDRNGVEHDLGDAGGLDEDLPPPAAAADQAGVLTLPHALRYRVAYDHRRAPPSIARWRSG